MTGFDPTAATQAYLSTLPHPPSMATHWVGPGEIVLLTLAAFAASRSGLLEKLAASLERERPRPWLVTWTNALALSTWLAAVDFAFRFAVGAPGDVARSFQAVILTTAALFAILAVARWTPRYWAPICGAVAGAAMFLLGWAPFVLASGPAALPAVPDGPVSAGVNSLVRETKLAAQKVYLSPGAALDADVTGTKAAPRVSITQGLAAKDPAEARAMLGHVMGHFAHRDPLSLAALVGSLTFAGFLAVGWLFRPLAKLLGAGAPAASEPAALPVVAIVALGWMAIATPGRNGFIREINVAADQYSLDHAREPDGLAKVLVDGWAGDPPAPSTLEEVLFYDHPPLASRIRHAMDWKARNAPQ